MQSQMPQFIAMENQYIDWSKSKEKTKEFECKIKDVDLKIILIRGRAIYPDGSITPAITNNTFNISSNDDEIKQLFEQSLVKSKKNDRYHFPNDKDRKFELRFFPNEISMKVTLLKEEKKYEPNETKKSECIIV